MGEIIDLSGKRLSTKGAELETPDIAAAWQQISTTVAIEYGIVNDIEAPPHFMELHPVMQGMMCEAFQQMIDLGIIRPGYESAVLELKELGQKAVSDTDTPVTP